MRGDQLFEALPPTKYRQYRWITIGGEEPMIVMPSRKHSSGGMLATARAERGLIRLKDSRNLGS
jgi:hypothetical protein